MHHLVFAPVPKRRKHNYDIDFNIYFNLSNEFEDLNDDWDLISRSDSKIELFDVSGGNGGTDYLTFEKN